MPERRVPDPTDPPPPSLDPASLSPAEEAVGMRGTILRRWLGRTQLHPSERGSGITPDGRLKSGRLRGLSMNRAIWVLSWPILAESLLNSLVGVTDMMLAAAIGEAAADGLGAAAYVAWFLGLTGMALGVGATAIVARSVAKGRLAVANAAVGQTLLLQVVCGLFAGLLVIAGTPLMILLYGLEAQAAAAFRTYLFVLALGVPLMGILTGGTACLRGSGDSLRPLAAMVVVNIVNVVFSWVLSGADWVRLVGEGEAAQRVVVIENPFNFDMGVLGIALGTVIAQAVGAAMIVGFLIKGRGGVRLRKRRLRPHWHTMRRLARLGLPNFFETMGMWIGNYMVALMVGWIGAGALGAHLVAIRIEAFSFLPGFSMGIAAATLVGQYLGAGSAQLARVAVRRCTFIAMGLMGCFGFFFLVVPRQITSQFTSVQSHMDAVPTCLMIAGAVQIPFAIALVLRSALRGAGDTKAAMWITWITTYGLRLPMAFLFSGVDVVTSRRLEDGTLERVMLFENPMPWDASLAGLWIGLCAELVIRALLFGIWWLRGKWVHAKV